MPAFALFSLFVFTPALIGLFVLASNSRVSAAVEEKIELFGERVGATAVALAWKILRLQGPAGGIDPGSFYADMTSGRHEALPLTDGKLAIDQRVLFLHELELNTRMNFISVENHTVTVSPKQAKRIEEFIRFSPAYGDNVAKVFVQHGYVLEIA